MKKYIIFLIIFLFLIFLNFNLAKADGFYIKFLDNNEDGKVSFKLTVRNTGNTTYYTGIAPYNDRQTLYLNLEVPPHSNKAEEFLNWELNGNSLYDVYLKGDNGKFFWSSEGYANYSNSGNNEMVKIHWQISPIKNKKEKNIIKIHETFSILCNEENGERENCKDGIKVVPVPLSSNWLFLALGLLIFGVSRIIYKKFNYI